jgi:hypothetical protein
MLARTSLRTRAGGPLRSKSVDLRSETGRVHFAVSIYHPQYGLTGIAIEAGKIPTPALPPRNSTVLTLVLAWGPPAREWGVADALVRAFVRACAGARERGSELVTSATNAQM